jgi:cysteine desulfurase
MSPSKPVYLDYNSTTPCAKEVVDAMLPFFSEQFGNAANSHAHGRSAACAVEIARAQIAETIGCDLSDILFTSGATESNNLAILGVVKKAQTRRKLVVSAVEHKSVLEPCRSLISQGFVVVEIPVTRSGLLDIGRAEEIVDEDTLLVSVQAANNETGVIQPVHEMVALAHRHGALVHCDAAQVLGKIVFSARECDADVVSLSAHKAYGPKGIGVLVARGTRARAAMSPLFHGGGQEAGLRSGTLNVSGAVGFGRACKLCYDNSQNDSLRVAALRDTLEMTIKGAIPWSYVNGAMAERLPGTTSLTIPGIPADMLMANLPMLCLSNGSACNSGAPEPSHVLLSMGLSRADAESTIRISLGRYTSEIEVQVACRDIVAIALDLKGKLGFLAAAIEPAGGASP